MSKNNQPAFPVALEGAFINSENNLKPFAGMSLRDYFAAKVLQGWLACEEEGTLTSSYTVYDMQEDAEFCYRFADAMLKAREK